MENIEKKDKMDSDEDVINEQDFQNFMLATGEEQFKILLTHAEKNRKIIKIRRLKTMEQYNNHHYEEISKQFEEFCHTKGIVAKFKVAFKNMAEGAREQKEADKTQFEEVKRKSAEANPEFTEFLHTKGFVAKIKLIGANLKKGCKEASHKTAVAVDNISAQTKSNIAKVQANAYGINHTNISEYSANELSREFNEFLKAKGLDSKYVIEVTDEKED